MKKFIWMTIGLFGSMIIVPFTAVMMFIYIPNLRVAFTLLIVLVVIYGVIITPVSLKWLCAVLVLVTQRHPPENAVIGAFLPYAVDFGNSKRDLRAKDIFYRGFRKWQNNQLFGACRNYKKAIGLAENRCAKAKINFFLALCELDRHRYAHAEKALRVSVRIDPCFDLAWYILAQQCCGKSDHEAERVSNLGVLNNPRSVILRAQRAQILNFNGKYETALRDCLIAEKLDPENAEVLICAAIACAGIGDAERAHTYYDRAVSAEGAEDRWSAHFIDSLLEHKNGKTFALPVYTGTFVLQDEEQTCENCTLEETEACLAIFFQGDATFITLQPPEPLNGILFLQATILDGNLRLNIGVNDRGCCRVLEKESNHEEITECFRKFYQFEFDLSLEEFHQVEFSV